jgi:hypothetical protein
VDFDHSQYETINNRIANFILKSEKNTCEDMLTKEIDMSEL